MENRFETFTALINKISRNIRKIENREMTEFGLRSIHTSLLYHLYLNKSLTATELCEKCEEDKATVSRSLNYLEENGYLTCESKNAKRYKSSLYLTSKGMETGEKIARKISSILEKVGDGITTKERELLYRNLETISDNLEIIIKE